MAGLVATEKWIRQRIQLKHDNLDDVRSLSLPGAYQEKIIKLGSGLVGFVRVKHVDLSRNALTSLDGLENLKLLEKLNLYYNRIASLDELYKLRHNTNLKELDLRLNPVTKNESDYRLFVVHMLPSLRRLDDRSVRDSERRAALTLFSTDAATVMSQKPNVQIAKSSPEKSSVPRVSMVKSLGRPPLMVQDNDDELLDLVARTGGDLGQKREMTGSTARKPVADSYTKEELKVLNQDDDQQRHFKLKRIDDSPSRYGSTNNKLDTSLAASKSVTSPEKTSRIHGRSRVQFADENISAVVSPNRGRHFDSEINKTDDPNLKFQDQRQAYTKYISKANFTPAPPEVQDKDAEKTNSRITSKDRIRYDDTLTTVTSPSVGGDTTQVSQPDKSTLENYVALPKVAVEEMLNLVDRYWNGSKSLHRNNKFQGHLEAMLSKYIKTPAAVLEENGQLKAKLHDCIDELSSIRTNYQDKANEIESYRNRLQQQDEIKLVLEKANKDLDLLRSRYEKIKEENASLKSQVGSVESIQQLEMKYQSRLDEFLKENRTLKQELESLKSESSQVHAVNTKIQALTGMLQESHGALVATNRHLLEQLEETKERHQTEVEQLHWSYNQLKKTLSLSDLSS